MGDPGRRPITPEERVWLDRLGSTLRALRLEAGLTQQRLACRADLAERSIRRLEKAERRTREATLQRLAAAFVWDSSAVRTAETVLALLVEAAGPSLAPESRYMTRIDERQERRQRRKRRQRREIRAGTVEHFIDTRQVVEGGVLEHHRHRRWVSRRHFRENSYVRLIREEDLPSVTKARGGNLNLVRRLEWPDGEILKEYATLSDWRAAAKALSEMDSGGTLRLEIH